MEQVYTLLLSGVSFKRIGNLPKKMPIFLSQKNCFCQNILEASKNNHKRDIHVFRKNLLEQQDFHPLQINCWNQTWRFK